MSSAAVEALRSVSNLAGSPGGRADPDCRHTRDALHQGRLDRGVANRSSAGPEPTGGGASSGELGFSSRHINPAAQIVPPARAMARAGPAPAAGQEDGAAVSDGEMTDAPALVKAEAPFGAVRRMMGGAAA